MSRYRRTFLLALALLCSGAAAADAVEEIEDLLTQRWYQVEIVVFERLNVLDVNSPEQLTQQRPRQWPHNLMLVRDFVDPAVAAPAGTADTLFDATRPSAWCLGFPMLSEADPLHPMLLPRQEPPAPDDEEMARRAAEAAARAAELAEQAALEDRAPGETLADELQPDETALTDEPADEALQPLSLETTPLTLTPYLQLLADVASFETSLYDSSYMWLPDLTMEDYVRSINRQSHLRPLLHRRWRAPIPERAAPQPIYLASETDASAPATRTGFAKLEGHLSVTVGRYLHFAPTLWYHADNLGLAPIALPVVHALPGPVEGRYMQMSESRRMRSGDLHYLDHPKFGIVVRIDPVTIPDHLIAAWEALEAEQQPLQ